MTTEDYTIDEATCKNCEYSKELENKNYFCKEKGETKNVHCSSFKMDEIKRRENKLKDEKESIWDINEKTGIRKLNHYETAKLLLKKYSFTTIGNIKKEIYHYKEGATIRDGENIIIKEVEELAEGDIKNNDVAEVVGHIQRLTIKDRSILTEAEPHILCVGNGNLDVIKGELSPHTPKVILTHKIRWNFRPGIECKRIMKFLKEIFNPKDIPTIQEFIGYCLYRKHFIKKALLCVGEKDTGKTTFQKLLINLIGEENISGVSLHKIASDKFAGANLYSKLLNSYDDLSFRDIKDVGSFKIATGDGYVTAERKFGEQFQFKNYAKLQFNTNKISAIDDTDDDAYYTRWLIVFFNNIFDDNNTNTDKKLINKLITPTEMSGFLNWALEGLNRLLKNNKFSDKKTAEEIKLIMEKSSNPISAFAQDCLKREDDSWISKECMYEVYSAYINEYGGGKVTMQKFGRDLPKKANYIIEGRRDTIKKKSVTGWLNLTFNDKGFNSNFLVIYNIIISNYSKIYNVNKSIKSIMDYEGTTPKGKNDISENTPTTPKDKVFSYIKDNPSNSFEEIQKGVNIPEKDLVAIMGLLKSSGDIIETKPDRWKALE